MFRALRSSRRCLATAASPAVVSSRANAVEVVLPSGLSSTFHNMWLRDHCRCEVCCHPVTQQRTVDTLSIPADIKPSSALATADGLELDWNGHRSTFDWHWLAQHAYAPALQTRTRSEKRLWTSDIAQRPPTVSYADVMGSDRGVLSWLRRIDKDGFCFVEGVPATPEATEQLIRRIAFIRETHYGGFWDFTADLAHGDMAYTNLRLGAHTDTTYFSEPAGLQMFHLLSPRTTHEGGHSLLVDGFEAARRLRESNPDLYRILSTLAIPAHASGGPDTLIRPLIARPAFEHNGEGELVRVRWNGDDRDVIGRGAGWSQTFTLQGRRLVSAVEGFYEAYRAFETLLRSPELEYWSALEPGKALIFDNNRVLHGRSSFTGKRRLCGAYIADDDYRSRLRTLERTYADEEMSSTVGSAEVVARVQL